MYNAMVRMRSKKGFTLMEMLIVVAIIAILVAISIPVFNSQLEKAREATDQANVRAAKGIAVATYLTTTTPSTTYYIYDAVNGTLITGTSTASGYGKGTSSDGGIFNDGDVAGDVIAVKITDAGVFDYQWAASTTTATAAASLTW